MSEKSKMGIAINELITQKEIQTSDLCGKILAVDTYNLLYQFLTTIRAADGTPLMDSHGNITSHLVGLFSRTTKLMQEGLKLAFVFDGKPPQLKEQERERRKALKLEAEKKYLGAAERKDIEAMKKYAPRTSRLTPDLVAEAEEVIEALGLPIVHAPSEGEAQAAFIAKQNDAYACVSQDFDSLLHGAPKLVRNLSIAGKRKVTNRLQYESVSPVIINLQENLGNLGIDEDQLIVLAMLVGTDYNIGGIKGIGPKKALELLKKFHKDFDNLFFAAEWPKHFAFPWQDVFEVIKNMPVETNYSLRWKPASEEKLLSLLVKKHDFSEERVRGTLEKLSKESTKQKGLSDFLK